MYVLRDDGGTWVRITTPDKQFGKAVGIEGDMRYTDLVYINFSGRGVVYGTGPSFTGEYHGMYDGVWKGEFTGKPVKEYTISLGAEKPGGAGYRRDIAVNGTNLDDKFIVARVIEGNGVDATIMVMVISAQENATVSYSKPNAVVDVWLTDGMPNLTGGSLGVKVFCTASRKIL